jgi:pimeloyl-ACP methyl ester carboxylesterase
VPPQGLHWLIRWGEPIAAGVFAPERGPFPDAAALARAKARIAWLCHADPWMRAAFDANFARQPDGAFHPVLPPDRFDAIYHDVLGQPSPLPPERFTGPVLLVRASFSAMPFYAQSAWLRRRLPGLRVTHVVGEHSLHATNPVSLAHTITAFLQSP